jgi:hypothetical protein
LSFNAPHQSLSEHVRSLALAPDLKHILVQLAEAAERAEQAGQAEAILARARPAIPAPRPPSHARKPARHLRLVPPLAVLAPVGWLLRQALRSHTRQALAGGLIMATAAGAALTPDMMAAAPAAQVPVRHAAVHHRRAPLPVLAPAVPGRRKRRRLEHDETATPRASASPSPTLPPSPLPTVTPSPLPTTPAPSPLPTCPHPAGRHCHGGGAVSVLRSLAGLSGLLNQGVPSFTSWVLNPGPRLLAGSTVIVKQAATSAR